MRKPIVFLFTFIAAILLLGQVFAGAGDADPTWGQNGLATASFGDGYETANSALLDSAGRLLLAGYVEPAGYPGDFGIARFLSNGAPDPAFGSGGVVTTDFDENPDNAWSIVQRPGGGYLVAGETCDADYEACLLGVAAYTAVGALDASFGGTGLVTTDPSAVLNDPDIDATFAWAAQAAIQPDGKLVTANIVWRGDDVLAALVRYLPTGALDEEFGSDGIVLFEAPGANGVYPVGLRLLPDGKLLLSGALGEPFDLFTYTPELAFLARFEATGALDESFGVDGTVTWDDGAAIDGGMAAVAGNGAIYQVATAGWDGPQFDCAVRRFSAAGAPDATFGQPVIDSGRDDFCYHLEVVGGGRPVAMGAANAVNLRRGGPPLAGRARAAGGDAMLAARLTTAGALDATFGGDGLALFEPAEGNLLGWTGAVQPDGKVIVAGDRDQGGQNDFAAVRFQGDEDGPPPTPTATVPPPPTGPRLYLPFIRG